MEEYTNEELCLYIEKLQKKLTRYETRFSALVDAYKNLTEEKQVLETTLNTLSSKPKSVKASPVASPVTSPIVGAKSDPLGAVTSGDILASDGDGISKSGSSQEKHSSDIETITQDELIKSLEEKVSALSVALQSLTEGKNKMESAFQADKKAIVTDFKTQLEKYEEERRKSVLHEQEIKSKLCQEQIDRESEVKIHASMLKELQEIVTTERLEKDELRVQLNETTQASSSKEKQKYREYEDTIADLNDELQLLKIELAGITAENKKPDNIINNLTAEVEKIKLEHTSHLVKEQKRANYAEEVLKSRQQQEEERIAELESRLSELSEMVGNYEKQRQEDQSVIRKLHERLENLDTENSALATTRRTFSDDNKIVELQEQVTKLKSLLKITWKKADKNIEMIVSNSEFDEILKTDLVHLACQAEYKQLKDEFEAYKRQQKQTKFTIKDDKASMEVTDYKRKIEKLESEVKYLEERNEEKEIENLAVVSKLQVDITFIKDDCEKQIEMLKDDNKLALNHIEMELHKQRTRTVELLSEKDSEIERLQKTIYDKEDDDQKLRHERTIYERSYSTTEHNDSVVDEILVNSPTARSGGNFFHYTQQLSQYESELSLCRSQNIDLESAVRDAEHREQQVLDQMQALKEEIRRLERGRSRESANLEYLKNICLQFMLTDSLSVKKQMSLAISTILSFSPSEMKRIEKKRSTGWW